MTAKRIGDTLAGAVVVALALPVVVAVECALVGVAALAWHWAAGLLAR